MMQRLRPTMTTLAQALARGGALSARSPLLALCCAALLSACGADVASSGGAADASATADAAGAGTTDSGGATTDASVTDATTGEDSATATDTAASCPPPTGERPSRRSEQVGAFDAGHKRLVMFGGSFGVPENCGFPTPTFESETWTYDPACDHWQQVKTAAPKGRVRAAAAYVEGAKQTFMFGGRRREGTSGNYTLLKDLWSFDAGTGAWTLQSEGDGMSARFNHTMVHAPALESLIVFAGNTSPSGLQYIANQDVWTYRLNEGIWKNVATAGMAPGKRFFAGGLWDATRKRVVIYGGADESLFADTAKYKDDLWSLDFQSDPPKWERIDQKSSEKPDARFWGELNHDAEHDRYVLFGGHDDKALGNRNDLWMFDPKDGQWLSVTLGDVFNKPAIKFCSFPPDFTKFEDNTPERRNGGLVVTGGGSLWIAGGKTDCGVIDDLWRFDLQKLEFDARTAATVGEACVRKGGLTCNDYCF